MAIKTCPELHRLAVPFCASEVVLGVSHLFVDGCYAFIQ